jgi:hypothetical protein
MSNCNCLLFKFFLYLQEKKAPKRKDIKTVSEIIKTARTMNTRNVAKKELVQNIQATLTSNDEMKASREEQAGLWFKNKE